MFTQKISMDCTQLQYEVYLKRDLKIMGYEEFSPMWVDFVNSHVITNCSNKRLGYIGNTSHLGIKADGRKYLGSFNQDLFLALAAMTDDGEEKYNYGEWYITDNGTWIKYGIDVISVKSKYRHKATAQEIMEKFGKRELRVLTDEFYNLQKQVEEMSIKLGMIEGNLKKMETTYTKKEDNSLTFPVEVTIKPEFKVGDKFVPHKIRYTGGSLGWTSEMDKYDGKILTVAAIAADGDIQSDTNKGWYFSPSWCTKVEELYFPKKGEYFYAQFKGPYFGFISIYSDMREHCGKQKIFDKATLFLCTNDCYTVDSPLGAVTDIINIRPATAEEEALLDSKLAEKGLRFDKEKCELVDIPEYKKPAMGKMAILWDNDRKLSVCRFFYMINDKGMFLDNSNMPWKNAILFESPEQYKNFLKEK